MDLDNIIIKPIITEKSMQLAKNGRFVFEVGKKFSKTQIKKAIEEVFKVNVVAIATSIIKGKRKRVGTRRIEIALSPWKKAIVKLAPGEKISLFETGEKNK